MAKTKDKIKKKKAKGIARARVEKRREEAEARQQEHDSLSLKQWESKLDKRLGKGIGAQRERAKISKYRTMDSNGKAGK